MNWFRYILIFGLFICVQNVHALLSLESAILGDLTEKISSDGDALKYIFNSENYYDQKDAKSSKLYKERISFYRGFYEEGKNLINYCKSPRTVKYNSDWEKAQVKRATAATLQYSILDLLSKALPLYAKYFEFTDEEFFNFSDILVSNSCSNNLSIISKKTLKKNMLYYFTKESGYKLPSVDDNPLFSEDLNKIISPREARENEFQMALNLFTSACSWSGSSAEFGLMTPLFKNPMIYSFIVRQLTGFEFEWIPTLNKIQKKPFLNSLTVWCENLICRRVDPNSFRKKVFRMIGSENLETDLKNLYCEEILAMDYDLAATLDDDIKTEMKRRSFEDENYLSSYYVSLITGIPDFMVGVKNYSKLQDVFRSGMDIFWSRWAKEQLDQKVRPIYFEEPLKLEIIKNKNTFNSYDTEFKVVMDLSLGEFDRLLEDHGKLKSVFNIYLSKELVIYLRKELMLLDPRNKEQYAEIKNRLKLNIEKPIKELEKRYVIKPWNGNLNDFVAEEILEQIMLKEGKAIRQLLDKKVKIELIFNYGVFALKSIKHQRDVMLFNDKIKK